MNSSVTRASATSVMSSLCLAIRPSSRSNGPLKLSRWTSKPADPLGAGAAGASGGVATGDELTGELAVRDRAGVRGRVRGDGLGGHRRVGELHGPSDDGVQQGVAERLLDPGDDLAGVQRARV